MNQIAKVFIALSLLFSVTHQSPPALADGSEGTETADWDRAWWIEKTARTLSADTLFLSPGEVQALLQQSDTEIVSQLMQRPAFADGLAEFFLYFLGFKGGGSKRYENATSHPLSIGSAVAVYEGQDFFDVLLASTSPRYVLPLESAPESGESHLQIITAYQEQIEAWRNIIEVRGEDGEIEHFEKQAFCDDYFLDFEKEDSKSLNLFVNVLGFGKSRVWLERLHSHSHNDIVVGCMFNWDPTGEKTHAALLQLQSLIEHFASVYLQFLPSDYELQSVLDFRTIPNPMPSNQNLDSSRLPYEYWVKLQNSSTNRQRRRAAHFFRTYLCDDLTPIELPDTDHGIGDVHASQPECQSCHYKLDPMAGMFWNLGIAGIQYGTPSQSDDPNYVFDDGVVLSGQQWSEYLAPWKREDGTWKTGLVRSLSDESLNNYGNGFEDLLNIIQEAPEFRSCIVRRMATFYLGKDQTFDGGWLRELENDFEELPNSGLAFRSILKKLVTSHLAKARDPNPELCYDTPSLPGEIDASVPCRVRFLLEENCQTCHNKNTARGGLDVTSWVEAEGGQTFRYIKNGEQVSAPDSRHAISERLTTTDSTLRMPPGFMPDTDRSQLLNWLHSPSTPK